MSELDTAGVKIETDVVYASPGGRDLLCDIYRPAPGTEKRTALIHLHGGGFTGGSKQGARLAAPLAALGYVGVAVQYRLSGEAKWPAQIQDTKSAIRWTRANAEKLGVDPANIGVVGYSAGSLLALVAAGSPEDDFGSDGVFAATSTELAACVVLYAKAEMSRDANGIPQDVMPSDATDEDLLRVSSISFIAPSFPPTILLHGNADTRLDVVNSFRLYHALREVGTPVELHVLEGLEHVFDAYSEFAELSARTIDLFLDRKVVDPREYPSRMGAQRAP